MSASLARRKTSVNPWTYAVGAVLILFIAYNSVYIKKLDEVKAASNTGSNKVDAVQYAQTFWTTKLIPSLNTTSVNLSTLLPLLKTDKNKAFTTYSQALGIGNIRYFLVKGEGTVTAVNDNDIAVLLTNGEIVHLATDYIFGNAARDASGLIKITEFDNTTDLNNISAAINDIIRKEVVPALKAKAKPSQKLMFAGAAELNQAHLHLGELTIIPISVK